MSSCIRPALRATNLDHLDSRPPWEPFVIYKEGLVCRLVWFTFSHSSLYLRIYLVQALLIKLVELQFIVEKAFARIAQTFGPDMSVTLVPAVNYVLRAVVIDFLHCWESTRGIDWQAREKMVFVSSLFWPKWSIIKPGFGSSFALSPFCCTMIPTFVELKAHLMDHVSLQRVVYPLLGVSYVSFRASKWQYIPRASVVNKV